MMKLKGEVLDKSVLRRTKQTAKTLGLVQHPKQLIDADGGPSQAVDR